MIMKTETNNFWGEENKLWKLYTLSKTKKTDTRGFRASDGGLWREFVLLIITQKKIKVYWLPYLT